MKKDYTNITNYCFALILSLLFSLPGLAGNGFSDKKKVEPKSMLAGPFYPSSTGGNWSSGAAWSTVSCGNTGGISWPTTSADNVNITCAKTINVGSTVTGGALTISAGTLIINPGSTLTVASLNMTGGTLTVNGTLNVITGGFSITGGVFSGTGTVGLSGGAQNLTCTQNFHNLNIAGSGNKTMLSNVTVGNQLLLNTNNLIVGGNLLTLGTATSGAGVVNSGGKITLASNSSLSLGGSYNNPDLGSILSNTWPLTIANFTMTRNLCVVGAGTNHNLTVTGAFTLTAGTFIIGTSHLTLNGTISGNINGEVKGSLNSDLTIGGSGNASMYFDLGNTAIGGSNTIRNFTNNRTSSSFTMLSNLRIGGVLTETAGSSITITTGSVQNLTIDGTVSGQASLVGHSLAGLNIFGSGALGGSIAFVTNQTLSSLTMNRASSGTATLASAVTTGSMSFTNGILTNPFLTTATGSVFNTGGASSYLSGALARSINPGTNSTAYVWPIGKNAYQKLTLNGITTSGAAGNVVIKAEAFDGNSNGTAGSGMLSLRTDNFWSAQITSNEANLLSVGTISLNESSPILAADDVVGYSQLQSGSYDSLGGTVSGSSVTSTADASVALGFYNIGTGQAQCVQPDAPALNTTSSVNCGIVSTTLSIVGGSLNNATAWHWYEGICGGTEIGTGTFINVSPTSTTTYFVRGEGGCTIPGICSQITITVNSPQNWYLDADNDGHYVNFVSQCTSPGLGYNTTATIFGDCNDSDAAIYQNGTFYIDADSDGYSSGVTATVCYGTTTPPGYLLSNTAIDCNDNIAAINPGATEILYNGVDDNCDGNLDEGFQITTQIIASQCGTTLPAIGTNISAVSKPQATGYKFEVTNMTTGVIQTIVKPIQYFSLTQLSTYDYATTYSIRVELQRNNIWLGYYGTACMVSSPAVTSPGGAAQVTPSQCGITLSSINTLIATTSLPGVTGYRFRVTNISNPTAPNLVQQIDRTVHWFNLPMLTTFNYNTTYLIEVAVKTSGAYSAFGNGCQITTPAVPQISNCGGTVATGSTYIYTASLAKVTSYRFEITNLVNNNVVTIDRSQNWFTFNQVGFEPATLYGVRVALMTSGVYSLFGDVCEITSPGTARPGAIKGEVVSKMAYAAYPNPFSEDFMIAMETPSEAQVTLKIYDMTGRLLESMVFDSAEISRQQIGQKFPAGVYNVVISLGDKVTVLRVLKR